MAKKPKKDATEEGAEAPAEPKSGKSKKLIFAIVGVVVLAAAGGGGYFFFGRSTTEVAEAKRPPKPVTFLDIREMTINLGSEPNQEWRRVLKFKAALEIHEPKAVAEITPLLPRVEDALQVFLRELRPSELEGSAAGYYLREELLKRVNIAIHPAKVEAVLFREILVQ